MGNSMAVRGAGIATQILLPSRGTIAALLTTGNGTTFTTTRLNTDAPAGAFYHGVAFDRGDRFWGKTNGGPLRLMEFDRSAKAATTLAAIQPPAFPQEIGPIAMNPVSGLLAGLFISSAHSIHLFDCASGTPILNDSDAITNPHPNGLFQGALDFYFGERLFALDSNNGLRAYRIRPPAHLDVGFVAGTIKVSWPTNLANVILQSRAVLGSKGWTPRTSPVPIEGARYVTTFPRTGTSGFYRLGSTLTMMSYNIHHAQNTDGDLDLEEIGQVIRDSGADLVGLQEVDRLALRSGYVDQPAELARLTGMHGFFGRNKGIDIGDYGLAVLSRFPIRNQSHLLLKRLDTSLEQRGVNILQIDIGGTNLTFINTHLDAGGAHDERLYQVAQIRELAQNYPGLLVICGDFNAVPGSSPHAQMAQDFQDVWPVVSPGNGYTFSSTNPNKRIDYFWTRSDQFLPLRAAIPSSTASDHLPLVIEWLAPKN